MSYFDYMTLNPQGKYVLKQPFATLVQDLEERSKTQSYSTAIPLGRSLQKLATKPAYFVAPRVVTIFDSEDISSTAVNLSSHLFLGYAPAATRIEVISFNPNMGRYEFQIVDNYGSSLEPTVRYVERAQCTGCHHAGDAIFSTEFWHDTPHDPTILQMLQNYHGGQYHSVKLSKLEAPKTARSMTGTVVSAHRESLLNFYWQQCDTSDKTITCRESLLNLFTVQVLSGREAVIPGTAELSTLRELVEKAYKSRLHPDGPLLSDFGAIHMLGMDTKETFAMITSTDIKVQNEIADRLGQILTNLAPVDDPADLRLTKAEDAQQEVEELGTGELVAWRNEIDEALEKQDAQAARSNDKWAYLTSSAAIPQRMRALIAQTARNNAEHLNMHAFLAGLVQAITPGKRIATCCVVLPDLPKGLHTEETIVRKALASESAGDRHNMFLFEYYCARCHGPQGEQAKLFVGRDPETLWRNLSGNAKVKTRLEKRTMPPADAPEGTLLQDNEIHRVKMLEALSGN